MERMRRNFSVIFALSGLPGCSDGSDSPVPQEEQQVGFEIIEIQSPNSFRAWISPETNFQEFEVLGVSSGWIKNQMRECAETPSDKVRSIKSPDATMEGDVLVEEFYCYKGRRAATVTDPNIILDEEGLLRSSSVRKFHEITYNAGKRASRRGAITGAPA